MKKKTETAEPQRASGSFSPEQVCLLYRVIVALQTRADPRLVIKDPAYAGLFQVVSAMLKRSGAPPRVLPDPEPEEPEVEIPFTQQEVEMLTYVLKTLLWSGDPSGIRHRAAFRPLVKKVSAMNQEVNGLPSAQARPRQASGG